MTIRLPTGGPKHGKHRKTATEVRQHTLGIAGPSPGGAANTIVQAQLAAWHQGAVIPVSTGPIPCPPETPIEDAGIRVGEVIAWRAWVVKNGWLYSVALDFEWSPHKAAVADRVDCERGIHAFKQRERAIAYGISMFPGCPVAVGQVALWGEIYEFDQGWHGQFARPHSIDLVVMRPPRRFWLSPKKPGSRVTMTRSPLIDQLRETYGMGAPE